MCKGVEAELPSLSDPRRWSKTHAERRGSKLGPGWRTECMEGSSTSILQQVSFRGFLGPNRSQLVTCWRMLVVEWFYTVPFGGGVT